MNEKLDYLKSGVNLDAADQAVERIKDLAKKTIRPGVINDIGGFGGLFALDIKKYQQPILVSGTDGVGTKLKIAFKENKHDSIGIDCVAMCVNDILVSGAEPLFFLDYLAVGKLNPHQTAEIVAGVADGCIKAGCALLGGETAEMPGFYPEGEYDLAGFAVGVVDKNKIIDGTSISPGDVLVGISSNGMHSNGFSLVRKIIEMAEISYKDILPDDYLDETGNSVSLGEELLRPTNIYVSAVLPLLEEIKIKGMVHITGGGLPGNIPRVIPKGQAVRLKRDSWQIPGIFRYLQDKGNVDEEEMFRVFNMGIGFVLITSYEDAQKAVNACNKNKLNTNIIGEVIKKEDIESTSNEYMIII